MGTGALLDRVAYQEAIWCLGRSVICHVQGLLFENTLKTLSLTPGPFLGISANFLHNSLVSCVLDTPSGPLWPLQTSILGRVVGIVLVASFASGDEASPHTQKAAYLYHSSL